MREFVNAAALLFTMALTGSAAAGAKVQGCALNGKPLYGKVQVVNSFPDFKVQIVKSFPDLKVMRVTSFPDACGKWQFVKSFPDFTIEYVESFPDLKIEGGVGGSSVRENRLLSCRRQLNPDKHRLRIEIVLARLVNHPQVSSLVRRQIGQGNVNLAAFERGLVVRVIDTNYELFCCPGHEATLAQIV